MIEYLIVHDEKLEKVRKNCYIEIPSLFIHSLAFVEQGK